MYPSPDLVRRSAPRSRRSLEVCRAPEASEWFARGDLASTSIGGRGYDCLKAGSGRSSGASFRISARVQPSPVTVKAGPSRALFGVSRFRASSACSHARGAMGSRIRRMWLRSSSRGCCGARPSHAEGGARTSDAADATAADVEGTDGIGVAGVNAGKGISVA